MKLFASFIAAASLLSAALSAEEVPKIFKGLFEEDKPIKGQLGLVIPPREIDKYVAKIETAARKDPQWFRDYSNKNKPGVPLPYDEKLGITKEEYAEYMALWAKREFKPMEDVAVFLRKTAPDTWSFIATGTGSTLATLRYSSKDDVFVSPNGTMKRLPDIKSDPTHILGEWNGREWKFEEETSLGKTKEDFALGETVTHSHCLMVYRFQEFSSEGRRLLDKSFVIRFPLGKGAPAAPAAKSEKPKGEKGE